LGIANFGLGIAITKIDVIQILNECYGLYHKWIIDPTAAVAGICWMYLNYRKEKNYIGFEILNILLSRLPAKFIITENAKLGIKILDVFGKGEGIADLSDDDVLENYSLETDKNNIITDIIRNNIWHNMIMLRDMTEKYNYSNDTVKTVYVLENTKEITLDGLSAPSDAYKSYINQRIFGVFGDALTRVPLMLKAKNIILQPSDIVDLTLGNAVNVFSGTKGITGESFKLISNDIFFDDGMSIVRSKGTICNCTKNPLSK